MFDYKTKIRLQHTDAMKRLFFGAQYNLVHEAFEEFLEEIGFSMRYFFDEANFAIPMIHSETDYLKQLFVGDLITIRVTVSHIGNSSFALEFLLSNSEGDAVGKAKTIHTAVTLSDVKKLPLPSDFKAQLEKHTAS